MNLVSLFSGVGGFELGFEKAGFKTVFQCEVDGNAAGVLMRHWPDVPKWIDVTTLSGSTVVGVCAEPDCVVFGSPCQDLSVAGRRAGIGGSRSSLFYEAIRVVKEIREVTNGEYPKWVVWENVAGALSSNGGDDFGAVLDEMAGAGAVGIEWAVLDAQYFGVPQRRRRVFVVAGFDSVEWGFRADPLFPVGESVQGNGEKDGYITFYTSQGRQDQYTKRICTSLKTAGVACITGPDIPPRRLTPVECERLMGWPDDHTRWHKSGKEQSDSSRYKQCGNGVAAPVAEWVADKIINKVFF
jgi:DNA (cytosine-5)-methyltransferase 1